VLRPHFAPEKSNHVSILTALRSGPSRLPFVVSIGTVPVDIMPFNITHALCFPYPHIASIHLSMIPEILFLVE
jgi:hypothetical protein